MKTLLFALALAVALGGCSGDQQEKEKSAAPKGKFEIFGSGTAAILVRPIADRFAAENPGVNIGMHESSSSWGVGYLKQGMTDMAMSIREIPAEEKELRGYPIGRDGLCMVVHKENPVEKLSKDEIAGIFTGKIVNWKEVGGKEAEITRVNHADVRASLAAFVKYLGLEASDIKYTDIVVSSDHEVVRQVAGKPNSVSYMSIAAGTAAIAKGQPLKLIGFDGVAPTVENVASGAAPIAYDVLLVTKGEPKPLFKAFIDFASSPAAQEIGKQLNFAPPKG